jgi:hypothetical protein
MKRHTRLLTFFISFLFVAAAFIAWFLRDDLGRAPSVVIFLAGMVGMIVASLMPRTSGFRALNESEDIGELSDARKRELVRGTSLFLREMKYRYSVRGDGATSNERRCFSAEVNTVKLGFLPAVITDNTNDRQGQGYLAYVHDGERWRGPGLPCPADQAEAVRHAARCVSPLAKEEETHFEGADAG